LRENWPEAKIVRGGGAIVRPPRLCGAHFTPATDGTARPTRAHSSRLGVSSARLAGLLRVPDGRLVSYGETRTAIGHRRRRGRSAPRRTKSARAFDPVSSGDPRNGRDRDYRWGAVRKRAMIAGKQRRGFIPVRLWPRLENI